MNGELKLESYKVQENLHLRVGTELST